MKTVNEMAREAGFGGVLTQSVMREWLERFAALVREDDKERIEFLEQQNKMLRAMVTSMGEVSGETQQEKIALANKIRPRGKSEALYMITAAIAARQMRDAALKAINDNWDRQEAKKAIAALPVLEIQWRDIPEVAELLDTVWLMHEHLKLNSYYTENHNIHDKARAVIAKFKEKQL